MSDGYRVPLSFYCHLVMQGVCRGLKKVLEFLGAAMWVLRIAPRSYERAVSVLCSMVSPLWSLNLGDRERGWNPSPYLLYKGVNKSYKYW